jgi:hypothetical protein
VAQEIGSTLERQKRDETSEAPNDGDNSSDFDEEVVECEGAQIDDN